MDNDQATPNAETQPDTTDADRTAGTIQDAGIQQYQAQIDAIVQSRLAEERRRLQTKYGDLDAVAKKAAAFDEAEAAKLSELEKLQKQLADKDAEIAAAKQQAETERLNALRLRVGQEVGLPPVLAARLQGADEDELRADAESVKAVLGGGDASATAAPNLNATAGGEQPRRSSVKLSPSERQAADVAIKGGLFKSYEEYAEALRNMQGD